MKIFLCKVSSVSDILEHLLISQFMPFNLFMQNYGSAGESVPSKHEDLCHRQNYDYIYFHLDEGGPSPEGGSNFNQKGL